MTSCKKIRQLFAKVNNGLISENERNILRMHIKSCAECEAEYARLNISDLIIDLTRSNDSEKGHVPSHYLLKNNVTDILDIDKNAVEGYESVVDFLDAVNARSDIPEPLETELNAIIAENNRLSNRQHKIVRFVRIGALPLLGSIAASLALFIYLGREQHDIVAPVVDPNNKVVFKNNNADTILNTNSGEKTIEKIENRIKDTNFAEQRNEVPANEQVVDIAQEDRKAVGAIAQKNDDPIIKQKSQKHDKVIVAGVSDEVPLSLKDKPPPFLTRECTIKIKAVKTQVQVADATGNVAIGYKKIINIYGEEEYRSTVPSDSKPELHDITQQIQDYKDQVTLIVNDSDIQGNVYAFVPGPPPYLFVEIPVANFDLFVSKLKYIGAPQKILGPADASDAKPSEFDHNSDSKIQTKVIIDITQ